MKPTPLWVSCKSPISCAQFNICLEQHGSLAYEIVYTLFSIFWWTRSQHPTSELRKKLCGESCLHCGSAFSHPSLVHSSRSFSAARQSCSRNGFHKLLIFSVDQVLASQIRTEEETLWVKLPPLWISFQSPISYKQFKICLVQHDSPVSEIVFTLFSFFFFFGGPSLCILEIKNEEETLQVKLTPLWVSFQSPISCTQFRICLVQHDSSVSETVFTPFSFFWWTRTEHPRSGLRSSLCW